MNYQDYARFAYLNITNFEISLSKYIFQFI